MFCNITLLERADVPKKASATKKARHFIASLKGRGIRLRGFSNRLRLSEGKKCRYLFFPLTLFLNASVFSNKHLQKNDFLESMFHVKHFVSPMFHKPNVSRETF